MADICLLKISIKSVLVMSSDNVDAILNDPMEEDKLKKVLANKKVLQEYNRRTPPSFDIFSRTFMEKVPLILGVLYNDTKVESVSFSYNFDNETITITGNSDLQLMTSALININSLDAVVYVSCSSKKRVREETSARRNG